MTIHTYTISSPSVPAGQRPTVTDHRAIWHTALAMLGLRYTWQPAPEAGAGRHTLAFAAPDGQTYTVSLGYYDPAHLSDDDVRDITAAVMEVLGPYGVSIFEWDEMTPDERAEMLAREAAEEAAARQRFLDEAAAGPLPEEPDTEITDDLVQIGELGDVVVGDTSYPSRHAAIRGRIDQWLGGDPDALAHSDQALADQILAADWLEAGLQATRAEILDALAAKRQAGADKA